MFRPLILALCLASAPALAQDVTSGSLTIHAPHAIETPPRAPVAGGYLRIVNSGDTDDRFLGLRVDATVAGDTQLHQMRMAEGVMQMDAVPDGIPIPAGETVTLERGGLHVMFLQLPDRFEAGQSFPATLLFEQAGEVEVTFEIRARGKAGSGHGTHGH